MRREFLVSLSLRENLRPGSLGVGRRTTNTIDREQGRRTVVRSLRDMR
jgi:hypothetical protein